MEERCVNLELTQSPFYRLVGNIVFLFQEILCLHGPLNICNSSMD
jgi:hypothetical protein